MAAIQIRTFKDIVDAVREEVKIQSTDTSTVNRIKRDVNLMYQEIASAHRWTWLRKQITAQSEPAFFLGTANVLSNSREVTLTEAPADSKRGFLFSTVDFEEVYKIKDHTPGSNTMILDKPYMGRTNTVARFWIWSDAIALPVEVKETQEAWIDQDHSPLQAMGFQDFRNSQQLSPKASGRPQIYSTTGYRDPDPWSDVAGLPSVATRASSGYVRSLKFSATLGATGSTLLNEGDRVRITGAGHPDYNDEVTIKAVSTTDAPNDTIQYVARNKKTESQTAATSTTLQVKNQQRDLERYRELLIHPSLFPTKITVQVETLCDITALDADNDEPLIPIEDRQVLFYGAVAKAWKRERNIEMAAESQRLFDKKLQEMMSRMEDSYEQPLLEVNESYLRRKRYSRSLSRARRS